MGFPSETMRYWENFTVAKNHMNRRRTVSPFPIASPAEDRRILESRRCTQEGVRAGAKAAAIWGAASAVPTLIGVRKIPWAKANLNYTAQALIISAASIAAYFITADKTILDCARRNAQYDKIASHIK